MYEENTHRERLIQDVMQYTLDALAGVDLPEGDFDELLRREVIRAIDFVENKLQTSLTPARRTNLPKTPREAYENRRKFVDYINNPGYLSFPRWDQLTTEQKALYGNNPDNYVEGSLPWDLLTEEQRIIFSTMINYDPNKEQDAERQDGKNTAYILTYRAPIIWVDYVAFVFTTPPGYEVDAPQKTLFFRKYLPSELKIYKREGGIHIFPAVMARLTYGSTQDPMYGGQWGPVAPRIPQVIEIDYTYGYEKVPPTLMQAVAYRAGMNIIQAISAMYTAGLAGFGVEGFNASFNDGIMYKPLYDKFRTEFPELIRPFYRPVMTAW